MAEQTLHIINCRGNETIAKQTLHRTRLANTSRNDSTLRGHPSSPFPRCQTWPEVSFPGSTVERSDAAVRVQWPVSGHNLRPADSRAEYRRGVALARKPQKNVEMSRATEVICSACRCTEYSSCERTVLLRN